MLSLYQTVCLILEVFIELAFVNLCLDKGTNNFSHSHLLRPMVLSYPKHPFRELSDISFLVRRVWFLVSSFSVFRCASVSPVISTSKTGSVGSTSSGLSCNRLPTSDISTTYLDVMLSKHHAWSSDQLVQRSELTTKLNRY